MLYAIFAQVTFCFKWREKLLHEEVRGWSFASDFQPPGLLSTFHFKIWHNVSLRAQSFPEALAKPWDPNFRSVIRMNTFSEKIWAQCSKWAMGWAAGVNIVQSAGTWFCLRSDTKNCTNGQYFAFKQINCNIYPGYHHVKADVLTTLKLCNLLDF